MASTSQKKMKKRKDDITQIKKSLPPLQKIEIQDIISKLLEFDEDVKTMVEMLINEPSCYTNNGNGRIKKSELASRLGWTMKRLEDAMKKAYRFIDIECLK